MPADLQPALGARAPFLNELLAYTEGDGWSAPVQVGDRVEVYDRGWASVPVVGVVDGHAVVQVTVDGEVQQIQLGEDDYFDIVASPYATAIWERHQQADTPDGVAWSDTATPPALRQRLNTLFDTLCEAPADYHPGSNDTVRDLVHPSLYPYVHGISPLAAGVAAPTPRSGGVDRWGRPYEGSRYQWLPTDVEVSAEGEVRFLGPLNQLDPAAHPEAAPLLAELLQQALPLLESVYGYAQAFDPWDEREDDCEADLPEPAAQREPPEPVAPVSLRGRRLQVVPKLVQYELQGDAEADSVWHVEGMSHEHIVATVVCVVHRDPELTGGTLRFRRGYTRDEAGQVFWNIAQVRPSVVDGMVDRRLLPVGSVETPAGRMLAFPNSHVHKLTPMRSASGEPVRRRIAVFWLVDPEVRILSTGDVLPQQGVVPLAEAQAHRRALMEERKRHKQSHNLREISLCEH